MRGYKALAFTKDEIDTLYIYHTCVYIFTIQPIGELILVEYDCGDCDTAEGYIEEEKNITMVRVCPWPCGLMAWRQHLSTCKVEVGDSISPRS